MSSLVRKFAAATLVSMFATAAVLSWNDKDPPLTPEGEKIRDQIQDRLSRNSPYELTPADKCAAHYIALQQSEEQAKRDAFRKSARQDGQDDKETARIIAISESKDTPYALEVFMICGSGQKPKLFAQTLKP